MVSIKRRLSAKAIRFIYDHQQLSRRGQRLGDSYRDVKKTIENLGRNKEK